MQTMMSCQAHRLHDAPETISDRERCLLYLTHSAQFGVLLTLVVAPAHVLHGL